jgi:hypothetical protein
VANSFDEILGIIYLTRTGIVQEERRRLPGGQESRSGKTGNKKVGDKGLLRKGV